MEAETLIPTRVIRGGEPVGVSNPPTYLQPTFSTLIKNCEKSPQKAVSQKPWLPPSPSPQAESRACS